MKSLMQLLTCLTQDLGQACRVSTTRDLQTISARIEAEGLSFLTITLPTFSKVFESSLANGSISSSFPGFKTRKGWRIPAFLQEFTKLVFDPVTGVLLEHPDPTAIYAIRQITLAFKKYEAECTPKRERKAMEQFVLTDLEVAAYDDERPEHLLEEFAGCATLLFGPVLRDLEKELRTNPDAVVPKHGPGATADRYKANAKYQSFTWTKRLQRYFPAEKFLIPNEGFLEALQGSINFKSTWGETPVRVVSVPKTLKTPRIIGIEPTHMQYVQQGLLEHLAYALQRHAMHDAIGITDQTPNQVLACVASKTGEFATLDLSEASDRVSNQLVKALFRSFPTLGNMVQSCRSSLADVPGHGVIPLAKFASMGSALCFPIEAMVFLTIIRMATLREGYSGPRLGHKSFLRSVRVYGDDIIVPTDMAQSVISELEAFGLKVNRSKSFWTGKFRESCGGDFYDGTAVKPLYIKTNVPRSRQQVEEMVSTSEFRNHAYLAGLQKTVAHLDTQMCRVAPYPFVSDKSPVIGRLGVGDQKVRRCPRTHVTLVRGLIPRSKSPRSHLDGAGALMKFFLKRGLDPIFAKDHLTFAGRPKFADTKLGWWPA